MRSLQCIGGAYLDLQSSLNVTLDHSNIYTRLANDHPPSETDLHSTAANDADRMARREKKMHERWFNPSASSSAAAEAPAKKVFLGVDFPPIAVLRRKFTSKSNENNRAEEQQVRGQINASVCQCLFSFHLPCRCDQRKSSLIGFLFYS